VPTREADEFERIQLWADIEKSRVLVAQYEEGQAFFRKRIENHHYESGRLDERLDTRND